MKNYYEKRIDEKGREYIAIEIKSPKHGDRWAYIDVEDFDRVNEYAGTWALAPRTHRVDSRMRFYVSANVKKEDCSPSNVLLHRWILQPKKGMVVDHVDGNPLNNRRENLRVVPQRKNLQNQFGATAQSKTGCLGVFQSPSGKFYSQIRVDGQTFHLGTFETLNEASEAYWNAKMKLHDYFAEIVKQEQERK
jgi:hypothetical protein